MVTDSNLTLQESLYTRTTNRLYTQGDRIINFQQ